MKIILTVILSLCWKPQNVPLPMNGYFKSHSNNKQEDHRTCIWQTHPDIRQQLEPTQHETSLPDANRAPFSQENQLSGAERQGWFPEGIQWPRAGMAGSDSAEPAGDKQSNINALSAVLPRKIKITWGVTGEKSPAKTYILPKHLKPKYWLFESSFEQSPTVYYSALGLAAHFNNNLVYQHTNFNLPPVSPTSNYI